MATGVVLFQSPSQTSRTALTGLESLDGNRSGVVPEPLPDLPELSVPELADKLEAGPLYLPLVPRVVRQVCRHRLLNLNSVSSFYFILLNRTYYFPLRVE
jgi:hypothetical protein